MTRRRDTCDFRAPQGAAGAGDLPAVFGTVWQA